MRQVLIVSLIAVSLIGCNPSSKKEAEIPFPFQEAKAEMKAATSAIEKQFVWEDKVEKKTLSTIEWTKEFAPLDSALQTFYERPDIESKTIEKGDTTIIEYRPQKSSGSQMVDVKLVDNKLVYLEMTREQTGTFNQTFNRMVLIPAQGWEYKGKLKVYGLEEKDYRVKVLIVT
ncbi:hypothetical protein KFE98_06800 [bacterium SCSIO 12741]|nr:hypothetical protein KFE98_06800 [bacterium SCSIO 12741]